ncbi:MAG: class I SAM-dependent methyltransferase [Sporolactobacillus sp.]
MSVKELAQSLFPVLSLLDLNQISYTLDGEMAVALQGVPVGKNRAEDEEKLCQINFQWDASEKLQQLLSNYPNYHMSSEVNGRSLKLSDGAVSYCLRCTFGEVVRTDPDRLLITIADQQIPVKCLDYFLRELPPNAFLRSVIKNYLRQIQQTDAFANGDAWNEDAYQAWIKRFGTPEQAGMKIMRNPRARLGTLAPYLSERQVANRRIINLLGSHGGKAIALAAMGAKVTVVDISEENAAYARKTAEAVHIPIRYIVADVLSLPEEEKTECYDYVVMELGILHYFIDLDPLAELVAKLLTKGGRMVLHEFHPVSMKLVTTKGKKQVVFGNYFDKHLITRTVAYEKHLESTHESLKHRVLLKEWTLGEIITAFASAGLHVERLDETPNQKIADIGLPKLFTLVCSKLS